MCKAAHYLGWDGDNTRVPLAELLFVCNMACWAYTRLYVYPLTAVQSTFYERHLKPGCSPEASDGGASCTAMAGGLALLFCLHAYWFAMMIKVVIKILVGDGAQAAAGQYLADDELKKQRQQQKDK